MLSSPPCPGCTTHTGCEAIPGPSGTTFNDLDTATHLQSEPGIASIQNHGTGNDTSRGTLPVLCLAPSGAGQPGGPGGDTWFRVAGHTSAMEAMPVATPSSSPHAAVNTPPFPFTFASPVSLKHARALINLTFSQPRPPYMWYQITPRMRRPGHLRNVAPKPPERSSAPARSGPKHRFGTMSPCTDERRMGRGRAAPTVSSG
jgi:hypothetical protein